MTANLDVLEISLKAIKWVTKNSISKTNTL